MREINDQYPEYAEPYEPVKGGKSHKGLYGSRKPDRKKKPFFFRFFALPGLLLLLAAPGASSGSWGAANTPSSGVVTQTGTEISAGKPDEPEQPGKPPVLDNPESQPLPDTPAKPDEPAKPDTPVSPDKPSGADSPDQQEDTDTPATPQDSPSTPAASPASPDEPDETHKGPTASISHIYYWYSLNHIEVEYVITANDAENITSYGTVTSVGDPSMSVSLASRPGAGTVDANVDSTSKLYYMSTDMWKTELTVDYTLDGETGTLNVSDTRQPENRGHLWLEPVSIKSEGAPNTKKVTSVMDFQYQTRDRHSYDVSITKLELGWMKKVTDSGGSYSYEPVGSTRTIWNGTGTCPVTGPDGPIEDGDLRNLRFTYNGTLDVTAPADAAEATHFYLIYHIKGTGTDTDETVYKIWTPTSGQTSPAPIETVEYVEPDVDIIDAYWWSTTRHAEVTYDIIANDATDISSYAKITYDPGIHLECTMPVVTGEGSFDVSADAGNNLTLFSLGEWTITVYVSFKLDGVSYEKEVSRTFRPEVGWCAVDDEFGMMEGPVDHMKVRYELYLVWRKAYSDDPHVYDFEFTKVEIEWWDDNSYVSLGSKTLWEGGSESPFYYAGPDTHDGYPAIAYSFWYGDLDASPPDPAATSFRFHIYGKGEGNDEYDEDFEEHTVTDFLTLP